ncbi:ABC transporter substrate-binding protein [Streptomyces sp. ME19-01-6]|uniref:ABC transporter substrate-binding protein n=1 Tax=Streptomyces sp. ME19-01-6 TaxID=3028686 RepID=UPI0029A08635|nr:ABC transporter substrate-binding protein [Streptomyces sp. ME19-01-6]MDX3233912.1 ABC transporter substrate-binding protein [Streptomyces sp. ME19-01-6]
MHRRQLLRHARLGLATLILVTTSACGSASLGGDDGGSDDDTVKIGLLVARSGVYASVGRDMEQGFQLYLEQHGGELGGRKVEVVTVDEGDSPQSGVTGATRLVQQDQVDAVAGVTTGPTALGSRDIFDGSQVPVLLGNTGTVPLGDELASDWVWRAAYDNGDPGRALGKYLAEDGTAGDVYLIAPDYSAGHETLDGFKETFPSEQIAGESFTPFGTTSDYSAYLAKIRASGAKQIFCFYAGGEAIEFTTQAASFGITPDIELYGTFLTDGSAIDAEGDAALGVRNSIRYNWDLDNAENPDFVEAYGEQYETLPSTPAATTYDVGAILDAALSDLNDGVDRAGINEALADLEVVNGVRGELSFDDTRTIVGQHYLTEVRRTDDGLRNVTIDTLPVP